MDALIKELKELVGFVENLQDYANVYPLNSDQLIQLSKYRKRINILIKQL